MIMDLNCYLSQRFPDTHKPGEDQFTRFVARNNGLCEVDLNAYLGWITNHSHQALQSGRESAAISFFVKEMMSIATGKHVGYVDETKNYFL